MLFIIVLRTDLPQLKLSQESKVSSLPSFQAGKMFCSSAEKDCEICLSPNLRGGLTTRKCADLGLDAEESARGKHNKTVGIE
jgi:hypothetical protein